MGMRVTYNRVELSQEDEREKRMRNYEGRTGQNFKKILKGSFAGQEYKSDSGYKNKGGFIFFFMPNWTISEAISQYQEIVNADVYDKHFLSKYSALFFQKKS